MPPKNAPKQWLGYLLIFGGALGYVLDGLLLSLFNQRYLLPAEFIVFFRLLVGMLVLWAFLLVTRRGSWKANKQDLAVLLLMGVLFEAVGGFAYTTAIFRIGVSLSTVLSHTAPLWVMLYVVLRGQEKLTLPKSAALGASFVGMLLITQVFAPGSIKLDGLGITMGLVCGLVIAAFFVISQNAGASYSPWTITFYNLAGGTLCLAIFQRPWRWGEFLSDPGVIPWLALLALGPGLLAVVLWIASVRIIPASMGSLVGAGLEPLLASVAAFLVLGERLAGSQLIGAGLIVASLLVLGVYDLVRDRAKSPVRRDRLQEQFQSLKD